MGVSLQQKQCTAVLHKQVSFEKLANATLSPPHHQQLSECQNVIGEHHSLEFILDDMFY